jgi:hypothetical protein
MKKLALTMVSVAIVLFISSSSFAFQKKDPRIAASPALITYVVNVSAPSTLNVCPSYMVTLSDKYGNWIAAPLMYHEGTADYVFQEIGPASGVRIANLEEMHSPGQNVCSQGIYTVPATITQKFQSSTNYLFYLYPTIIPGDD